MSNIAQFHKYQVIPLDKLVKAEWNYKTEDEELSAKLAENMKRNGQVENIIVRELDTGYFEIVNGNHRFDAMQSIGAREVVCFNLGAISEAQAHRLAIETNETRFFTDQYKLSKLLVGLSEEFTVDDLLATMPYNQERMDELINASQFTQSDPEDIKDDEHSGAPARDVYVQPGDIIELGVHQLCCMDCRSAPDVFKGRIIDLIVTDPPYGVKYVGKTKEALTIENDSLSEDELRVLWSETVDRWMSLTKEGGGIYASIPAKELYLVFATVLQERGILRQQLIWNKDSMVLGHSDYHFKHEPILYGWKPGASHYFTSDRTKTTVLDFARPKASHEHPTMKPIELWCELIANSSKPGDTVGDPFLGLGTTLLACEHLGRRCVGTEIDPKYCQVIIDRYQSLCLGQGKEFKCLINGQPIETLAPVAGL